MDASPLHTLYTRVKHMVVSGFTEHKRIVAISLVVMVVLIFSTSPHVIYAANLWEIVTTPQLMFAWVGSGVLWLMSGVLGITATLLNITILQTVTGMGNHINDIIGIQIAWALLRDMANILFIFGIVYIGLNLILGNNRHGHQQALARLVIIALVINFSLFITKTVVETSNIMANTIFRLIIPPDTSGNQACDGRSSLPENITQCVNFGITGIINNSLGLTTVFNVGGTPNSAGFTSPTLASATAIDASKIFYITTLGSIFILITAFVFASAAILLVIRFVILIILMVFSPLAFAAWILPSTSGYFSYWLRSLLNQSFFAPAYMLMMWIAIKIIEGYGVSTVTGTAAKSNFGAALLGANVSFASVFLNFAIITVFMVAALIVAKKLGAIGADKAYGIGKGWVNSAQSRVQSTAYKYKGSIAAGAAGATFLPLVAGGALLGAAAGVAGWKGARVGTKVIADESARFAGRKVNAINEKLMKAPVKEGGVKDTIRKATIGRLDNALGYNQRVSADVKSAQEKVKALSRDGNTKGSSDFLLAQREDVRNELFAGLSASEQITVGAQMSQNVITRDGQVDLRATNKNIKKKAVALSSLRESAREKYLEAMTKDFANDSKELYKQISTLNGDDLTYAYSKMTPRIRAAYEAELGKETDGTTRVNTLRKTISIEDQEKTAKEVKEVKERVEKKSRSDDLFKQIQDRQALITAPAAAGSTSPTTTELDNKIRNIIRVMSDKEVTDLKPEVLKSKEFAKHVTTGMLQKIAAVDSISQETKQTLRDNVMSVNNTKGISWLQDKGKDLFQ